jgi:hypothetical protein
MTKQDERVRGLAAAMALTDREYNSGVSGAPIELLMTLFALILTFGVFLTAFVPFGYITKAGAELVLQPDFSVNLGMRRCRG